SADVYGARTSAPQARSLLRVAPAECAVTPNENPCGGQTSAPCPQTGLLGSSGREGTTDSPSQGGHIMKADELKTITTDALDKLAALLNAGHSDQLTALLKTMSRFHKYSWHNVCLIASQRPMATRVAGFQT